MSFEFFFSMLMPVTMVIISFFLKNKATKPPSEFSGFRTKLSKSSQENWEFANKYAAKALLISGLILSLTSLLILVNYKITETRLLLLVAVQVGVYIGISILTEVKLKKENKK